MSAVWQTPMLIQRLSGSPSPRNSQTFVVA